MALYVLVERYRALAQSVRDDQARAALAGLADRIERVILPQDRFATEPNPAAQR